MEITLRHCKEFARNYFDDIVILSKSEEKHMEHILKVLENLKKSGFKLSAKKCKWFAKKVKLLGFIVSGESIEPDPDKVAAIKNRKPPRNVKELQTFLGLAGYYRKWCKNYAELAKPLHDLTKKETIWEWGEAQQNSFQSIINVLTSKPLLAQYVPGYPISIYADASNYAIGGVVQQLHPDGRERVIEYPDRGLKGAELNYGISHKECLAIVYICKKCRRYANISKSKSFILIYLLRLSGVKMVR